MSNVCAGREKLSVRVTIDHEASKFGVPVIIAQDGEVVDYATGIKTARALLGLSVAELAERLGVSLRTVNGWEQGRMPHVAALNMLGKLLRVTDTEYTRPRQSP